MTDAYTHFPEFSPHFDPLGVHPHAIPTEDIFDNPGVNVFINARWASHLTGMIERLIYLDAWEGTEAEKYAAIDKVVKIIAEFDKAENQGEKRIMQIYSPFKTHFHADSKVLTGNAIAAILNASQEFGILWRQNTGAVNDEFYFSTLLPAVQIDFDMCHSKSSAGGIVNVSMNSDAPTSWNVDTYNSTTQLNIHTVLSFVPQIAGLQTFKFKVASKHASSSGYVFNLTYIAIRPHYD